MNRFHSLLFDAYIFLFCRIWFTSFTIIPPYLSGENCYATSLILSGKIQHFSIRSVPNSIPILTEPYFLTFEYNNFSVNQQSEQINSCIFSHFPCSSAKVHRSWLTSNFKKDQKRTETSEHSLTWWWLNRIWEFIVRSYSKIRAEIYQIPRLFETQMICGW